MTKRELEEATADLLARNPMLKPSRALTVKDLEESLDRINGLPRGDNETKFDPGLSIRDFVPPKGGR